MYPKNNSSLRQCNKEVRHAFELFCIIIPPKSSHTFTNCDTTAARAPERRQNLTKRLRGSGQGRPDQVTAPSTCRHRHSMSHIHFQGKRLPPLEKSLSDSLCSAMTLIQPSQKKKTESVEKDLKKYKMGNAGCWSLHSVASKKSPV